MLIGASGMVVGMAGWGVMEAAGWTGWAPATCLPDGCFCEAVRHTLIKQPVNALSSLAFCLVALVVWLRGGGRSHSRDLFVFATMVIGLGSAFFHASLTFVGQTIDVLGMYLLVTLLLLWSAQRFVTLTGLQQAALYVLGNAGLLTMLVQVPVLRRYVFGGLVIAVVVLEVRSRRTLSRDVWWAVALLTTGFVIWMADITGTWCSAGSLVQGHAVWHLCGAAASYRMYSHHHQGIDRA